MTRVVMLCCYDIQCNLESLLYPGVYLNYVNVKLSQNVRPSQKKLGYLLQKL